MFSSSRTRTIFFVIMLVAIILRLWSLGSADMIDDEVYYSFRSIGYLDYIGADEQTTPLYWFDPVPAWAKLSFHDAPPLVFVIQHIFFSLLGTTIFVARLPFVLAGLGSVFLLFLIGKKLFNEPVGLLSMGLMAIGSLAVWTSRVALLEAVVIFFILLTWYFFLGALKHSNYWYWWGGALGLASLVKYTAFPVAVVFLLYLAFYYRRAFRSYQFYVGLLIALAIFSPVIVYNIFLFQQTGHFDLQFAALLGQEAPEWQTLEIKSTGGIAERFWAIGPEVLNAVSPVLATLLIGSFILALVQLIKNKKREYFLPLTFLVVYVLLLLVVKPLPRFVAMLMPFLAVLIGSALVVAWQKASVWARRALWLVLGLFVVYETLFSINTHLTVFSYGPPNIAFSLVRPFSADFGVNILDRYLSAELGDSVSAVVPQSGIASLDRYITERAAQRRGVATPEFNLLVYDPRLHEVAALWLFDRRFIYNSIPVAYADNFVDLLNEHGNNFFANYNIYFIVATPNTIWRRELPPGVQTLSLEQSLQQQGIEPEIITNHSGVPMFEIYKFSL